MVANTNVQRKKNQWYHPRKGDNLCQIHLILKQYWFQPLFGGHCVGFILVLWPSAPSTYKGTFCIPGRGFLGCWSPVLTLKWSWQTLWLVTSPTLLTVLMLFFSQIVAVSFKRGWEENPGRVSSPPCEMAVSLLQVSTTTDTFLGLLHLFVCVSCDLWRKNLQEGADSPGLCIFLWLHPVSPAFPGPSLFDLGPFLCSVTLPYEFEVSHNVEFCLTLFIQGWEKLLVSIYIPRWEVELCFVEFNVYTSSDSLSKCKFCFPRLEAGPEFILWTCFQEFQYCRTRDLFFF